MTNEALHVSCESGRLVQFTFVKFECFYNCGGDARELLTTGSNLAWADVLTATSGVRECETIIHALLHVMVNTGLWLLW